MPAGTLVARDDDIAVSTAVRVLVDDVPVAVVRDSDGELHALGDTCSHGEVSLAEGEVEGCAIECWGHGSQFDLRTGEPLQPPAFDPVPVFALAVEDGGVWVDVKAVINA